MGGLKRRKALKRLQRRLAAYLDHGEYPNVSNPGKVGGPGAGHIMHKPGSNKKRGL